MRRSTLGLVAALVAGAPEAAAQPDVPEEIDLPPWAHAERSYAGLNVEVWPSKSPTFGADQIALVFEPYVQVMVSEHWALTGSLPFGYYALKSTMVDSPGSITGKTTIDGDSAFLVGSVTVGGHYTANLAQDHLNLWAGLRLAIPTMLMKAAGVETPFGATNTRRQAPILNGVRGRTHAHRFAVEQVGIRPEMGLEWRIPADWLYLRSTLAPMVLAPVASAQDVDVFLDHITELEVRAAFGLGGGLAFQEAFAFTWGDKVQTALEPFIAYESPGAGFVARLGVLVGLDEGGPEEPQESDGTIVVFNNNVLPRTVTPRLRVGGTW